MPNNVTTTHYRLCAPIVTVLLTMILLTGCLGMKNSARKSKKNLVETFFVGDEGTQYFIKPLAFKEAGNQQMELDFTFRCKDQLKDSATVNMSLIGNEIVRTIDSVRISNNSGAVVLHPLRYLFADRVRDQFNSRFSAREDLKAISGLFNKNNWKIIVYRQGKKAVYNSDKASSRKIDQLRFQVFSLLQ